MDPQLRVHDFENGDGGVVLRVMCEACVTTTKLKAIHLPSRATRHNYHHAVVIDGSLDMCQPILTLTVLPMVAYSAIDPISGLSSTRWLLGQPADYQNMHIPVPYEQIPPVTPPHPPFPTPAQFGDGIELGGWKARRPSWIQAVPMFTQLTPTTKVRPGGRYWLTNISDIVQVLRTTSNIEH